MIDSAIAANRFGLGLRADEQLPADGRRWLLAQFDRFAAAPPAIAAAPPSPAITALMRDYADAQAQVRMERRVVGAPMSVPAALMTTTPPPLAGTGDFDAVAAASRYRLRTAYLESVTARANAALVTDTPFVERLVHFWSNHFAVSADKLEVTAFAGRFEFDAIRPNVLGTFADMLNAVERHPAMLTYLDQAQSIGPNSRAGLRAAATGNRRGLNENLAREIMELHTLGVRTGYAQGDVTEFARALTGWGVQGLGRRPGRFTGDADEQASFVFNPAQHEPGPRTILGRTYPEGGAEQAQAVLGTLAAQASTAHHVATKLAAHFAGDAPPPALVARLEAAFTRSNGDLPTVYRALIASPEAWSPTPVKFKTPWEWAISSGRALGLTAFPGRNASGFVDQLGQPVWKPGSPAGYDDIAASWAGPDAIMRRVEAAERLAGRIPSPLDARARAAAMFGDTLTPATAAGLARAESPGQALALLLVSPEFMRR